MPEAPFLPLPVILRCVVVVTEPPHWHLAPVALATKDGVRVILQDLYPIPPVMHVEVKSQAIPRAGISWAYREASMILLCFPQKSHVLHLGLVYCMADQKPTPVYYGIITVNTSAVYRHGPRGEFHSTIQAWDPPYKYHPVQVSHPHSLQLHGLLRHPRL